MASSSHDDYAHYVQIEEKEKKRKPVANRRPQNLKKRKVTTKLSGEAYKPDKSAERKKQSLKKRKVPAKKQVARRDRSPVRPQKTQSKPPPTSKNKEHKVEIHISSDEPKLPDIIRALYPDLSESNFVLGKPLPTGDVRIDVNGLPCLLIERKEVNDFVGSLGRKGRFREQRARMIEDRKEHPNLILMVNMEGDFDDVDWSRRRQTRPQVEGVCRDLPYKYNIHVVWTDNEIGLLRYLGNIERVYKKYGHPADVIAKTNYLDTFYVGRKRALKAEEYSAMALTLIEGVSHEIARAIMDVYFNLPDLISTYTSMESIKERENMLSDIKHGNASRRIGPALSSRVYKYLFLPQ